MITHLKTAHEEQYSNNSRTLGVLFNYSSEIEHENWKESFVYMFREKKGEFGMYIFFDTMFDLFSFMLYSEDKMKRAYMSEEEFDSIYDASFIEGTFREKLIWV